MGVQAAGSAALYDAWRTGIDAMQMTPIDAHTIADSISAGLPADRIKALAAVRETGGAYIKVGDEDILAAIPVLARGSGVFAEPAAAAAYAGLVKAVERPDGPTNAPSARPNGLRTSPAVSGGDRWS
jgi:threonine synthase